MQAATFKQWSWPLLLVSCIGCVITFVFIFIYYTNRAQLFESTKQNSQELTHQATEQLDRFVTMLQPLVETLAYTLQETSSNTTTISTALKQKPVEVAGFGVVLSNQQSALYFVENKDKQELIDLNQQEYDYTQTEWYQSGITGSSGITKPFTDPVTGDTVIAFYKPFYNQDQKTVNGIVFATQSIEHLKHVLSTLYLGTAGYWILTDAAGRILIHPNANIVKEKTSLYTLAEQTSDNTLRTVAQQTTNGKSSISSYSNAQTDQRSWLTSSLIPAAGNWLLFGIFDVSPHNDTVRRQLFHIIISALLSLFFLILFYLTRTSLSTWAWWGGSGMLSTVTAIAIALLWTITALYPHYKQEAVEPVQNKIGLYQILDRLTPSNIVTTEKNKHQSDFDYYLRYRYKTGKFVPTGFLIQDINFISKDQIEFVGIIWQRYFDGIHDDISRGFILQQLTSKAEVEEISRAKEGKEETIVWLVHAQLNQIMSYHNFPFDVKNIHIQVSHKDFDKNIILVPDLDSYSMLNPETLPGVSHQAHLAGWHLHSSFFGYEIVDYHTTFGMYSYGPFGIWKELDKSRVPELHFIVQAKRYLLETLTIDVITLLIIALILFILLFTYKEREFSNTLSTFGAVLFSTILAQQYFKVKVPSEEFVYFEAFYFIMYLAILITLIFTLLDYFKTTIRFITYGNNFIARLLFWPGLLGIVCMITVLYLY